MGNKCNRCGGPVPDDPAPDNVVVTRSKTHEVIPASGEKTKDPAFVNNWEDVTVEKPTSEVVCDECLSESDTRLNEVCANFFETHHRQKPTL